MNLKIRLLQLFNNSIALFGLWYVISTGNYYWLLVTFVSYFIIGVISVVVTLHRMLSHRSFKTYKWLENILIFLTVFSTVGPTIAWVGLHRYHHVTSDTDKDPHSPHNGVFKAWTGYKWKVDNIPLSLTRDLFRQPLHRFIFNNYFKIIIIAVVLLAIINPLLPVFIYFLPATMTLHGTSIVNILGHLHGYRTYNTRDKSTNSWIANLVSFGDGWHNNHHNCPANYRAGELPHEWDLCATFIELIKIDDNHLNVASSNNDTR
jgi:stearoyl-CoA desaturase (delta-9 desaturase)